MMGNRLKGSLLIILAMLIWGSLGVVIRKVTLSTGEWILLYEIVTITLFFLFMLVTGRMGKLRVGWRRVAWMFLAGAIAFGTIITYLEAFRQTTVANAVITHYFAPVLVAILAPILIKERIEKITLWALIFSLIGLFMIMYKEGFTLNSNHTWGIILGLLSAVFYALSVIINKQLLKTENALVMFFYQTCAFFLISLFFLPVDMKAMLAELPLATFYSIVYVIIASVLFFCGIKYVKAQHVAIIGYIEPVSAFVFAYIFLSEVPTFFTYVGGTLVLYSGYLVIKNTAQKELEK